MERFPLHGHKETGSTIVQRVRQGANSDGSDAPDDVLLCFLPKLEAVNATKRRFSVLRSLFMASRRVRRVQYWVARIQRSFLLRLGLGEHPHEISAQPAQMGRMGRFSRPRPTGDESVEDECFRHEAIPPTGPPPR